MTEKKEIQQETEKKSVIEFMAGRYGMERAAFEAVVKETVMPGNAKNAEFVAFLSVAKEYNLNPLTKEICAFPSKGKITPIVSIDGWVRIINEHQQLDGIEFKDIFGASDDLIAIECKIHRKDRQHPISATEYMEECARPTEPWKKWPRRMLRHKALIQAARYAFGFSGIYDKDEAERVDEVKEAKNVTPPKKEGKTFDLAELVNENEESDE